MKNLFIFALEVAVVSFLIAIKQASACSMVVNDNFQKNLLVAHAASELNISLSKVTSISITEYSRSFFGSIAPSDCPESLSTQARIAFKYKPSKNENCDASIVVNRSEDLSDEPMGPIESLEFSEASAACSTSRGVISPRPILKPIPIPVPVPIQPRHDHD